jgi:cysteine-S-conjugate beta-lyase
MAASSPAMTDGAGTASLDDIDLSSHSTCRSSGKGQTMDGYGMNTRVTHGAAHQDEWTTDPLGRSFVNPPTFRGSTVTYPSSAAIRRASRDYAFEGLTYGRHGNPTTMALEELFSIMEGADNAVLTGSGVAAVNASLLAFIKSGDHILITDAAYEPTRNFARGFLRRFGVATTFFDPTANPEEFEALFQPTTKVVLLESPASLSFEITDVDAYAEVAHRHGAKVVIDNTWGPTLFRPFEHGCDVSVNAATKYLCGHSDVMMGITSARDNETYRALKRSVMTLGCPPGPDDAYLVIRGMRTLRVRLEQHGKNGLALAKWLEERPEVARVMHPGLESHPQHELFKRQFSGSCGLFGLQLVEGYSGEAVDSLLDGLKLFSMGYSWGGYESLMMQNDINSVRDVKLWQYGDGYGQTLRIHAGLEDVGDLIRDIEAGLARLNSFPKEKL